MFIQKGKSEKEYTGYKFCKQKFKSTNKYLN